MTLEARLTPGERDTIILAARHNETVLIPLIESIIAKRAQSGEAVEPQTSTPPGVQADGATASPQPSPAPASGDSSPAAPLGEKPYHFGGCDIYTDTTGEYIVNAEGVKHPAPHDFGGWNMHMESPPGPVASDVAALRTRIEACVRQLHYYGDPPDPRLAADVDGDVAGIMGDVDALIHEAERERAAAEVAHRDLHSIQRICRSIDKVLGSKLGAVSDGAASDIRASNAAVRDASGSATGSPIQAAPSPPSMPESVTTPPATPELRRCGPDGHEFGGWNMHTATAPSGMVTEVPDDSYEARLINLAAQVRELEAVAEAATEVARHIRCEQHAGSDYARHCTYCALRRALAEAGYETGP